jgi:phage tail-like protein
VPVRLLKDGRLRSGTAMSGSFGPDGRKILWHEIETLGGPLADGAHLQLFFHTNDTGVPPPEPSADPVAPFDLRAWKPLPPDALRGILRSLRGTAARHLWIGAHLAGEGRQTPVLEQIRIDFDADTLALKLPAIYRTRAADPEVLERFLALFESFYTDVEDEIDHLGRRFDPAAAPADWLPWLADWLGLELDQTWPEEKKRRAIAGAFAAAARRGTPAGLRDAVRFETGVDIRISEPILCPVAWSLPEDGDMEGGRLGFDTVLAAFEPEGAVVGTTAILDGSFLKDEGGPGAHLYEAVAHQLCVQVYERQVSSPRRLADVHAVIEREKPAHTAFHLSVIRPRLRVGFQARLGIDTVLGGLPTASRLGLGLGDGPDFVLGGSPPGRIGEDSRIGIGMRLGAAIVSG